MNMDTNKVKVEVCCGSADDVIQAYKAGASRVELNSCLFHGGLTPTVGSLLIAKEATDFPIMTMVRPREGGFCYTEAEFKTMLCDAKALVKYGSDGIVFGFLNQDGTLDFERCKIMMETIEGKTSVFHRAIDVVPNWKEALDMLIELKVNRVLTSGQESNVFFGTDTVREMIEYANGRIEILPGAGITKKNMQRIIKETGCNQIHLAASKVCYDKSTENNNEIFYGGALYPPENQFNMTDCEYISEVVKNA